MLQVSRLDDLDYQKLFDRARAMIPSLTGEWTDLNDHDPGITTLQAFAWLCDSLNYYINATGETHRLNMLKLLGLRPRRAAARCRVTVRAETGARLSLPKGTRLLAGETVFELAEPVEGQANRMLRLYSEENGRLYDLTAFAGEDGGFAPILSDDPVRPATAYFGFEGALSGDVRLFFPVEEMGRNPFGDGFSLVDICWEYWDGQWRRAEILRDETCGLLRSGFLTLRLGGVTALMEGGEMAPAHYLRCAAGGCYDLRPRVGRAALCCAVAEQTDTVVRAVERIWNGEATHPIRFAAGPGDCVDVAVEEGDRWTWWHGSAAKTEYCGADGGCIQFDKGRFGKTPVPGSRVLAVIGSTGRAMTLGYTDGCASQRVEMDTEGLYALRLALCDPRDGRFQLYDQCPDLTRACWDDRVFAVDRQENCIVFGDSIRGVQPEAGLLIRVVELARSRFGGGNVLRGRVDRLEDPAEGVAVSNLENAAGGEELGSAEALEQLLEQKLRQVSRAVTAEDIRELTLYTPGLLIDSVAVIPMSEYYEAAGIPQTPKNAVLVAVKPRGTGRLPALSEEYARMIRQHLEGYRMLSTELRVCPARYVAVEVYGRIRLAEPGRGEDEVLEALRALIEPEEAVFGRRVDSGRIYSKLEMLPCVRGVSQLSLEYCGEGGGKNEHGDIVLRPDCLAYLGAVGIEFI